MRRNILALTFLAVAGPMLAFPAFAVDPPTLTEPETLSWMPAAGLPDGAQVAVLYGDPSKKGLFAVRFKFPAGYEIPTHSHPTDEFITILSGKGRMAFGENAAADQSQPLVPGTFMVLPAGAWHHLWIDDQTVLELHSMGPFDIQVH